MPGAGAGAGWRTEAGPSNVQHAGTQADTQSSYQLLSTNGNKWTAAKSLTNIANSKVSSISELKPY